jgi:large subunit ribosomal protein L13
MEKIERKTHTIDATDKILGRLAAQIVLLLRGKHKPDYVPNQDKGDFVIVKNVNKLKVTGKKMEQKKYYRVTGYLGHLKEIPLKRLFKERPAEVLKKAVEGMIPKNRLKAKFIRRLKITQ